MIINVHAGHNPDGKTACGAVGFLKESTEARSVKNKVIELLKAQEHTVYDCTVDNGTSQNDVLAKIVSKCNAHTADLDISIHFNAGANTIGNGVTTGTEVYIYSSSSKAKDASQRIANEISALGFRNRGVKTSASLYFLKKTKNPALLIECCFVDDPDDASLYNAETMAKAIVKGITGSVESSPVSSETGQTAEPSGNAFQPYKAWIKGNDVNVRSGANMNASVVEKASNGQEVMVWGQEGEWVQIDSGKYVHESLISKNGPSAPEPAPAQPTPSPAAPTYSKTDFIKEVQTITGAKVDGIAGPETLSKTITVSKVKNNHHLIVWPLQKYLNSVGFDCGTVDGIAGVKFDSAVKAYQKAKGCVTDGEITKGKKTWQSLLGLC